MKVKNVYLEPFVPYTFQQRLLCHDLFSGKGFKLAVLDSLGSEESKAINDKRIIRPVASHLEMVLTVKNLSNRQNLSRIADCYLQLGLKHPGYINQQSLSATLMLALCVANKRHITPLVAIRQLYNLSHEDLIREMQSLEFDHESRDGQFLQDFITVAKDEVENLIVLLRFILQIHSGNVLSHDTKQYDLNDHNRILILSTDEITGKNYYAQLLFQYFQAENPDVYLDCMAQTALLKNLAKAFSGNVYIAMTAVKLSELDGSAIYQAEKFYSAMSEDPKMLLQAQSVQAKGLPSYQELKDYCVTLPTKQLQAKYLEGTGAGIQEVVIGKDSQVKSDLIKPEKFIKQQPSSPTPTRSDRSTPTEKESAEDLKLKQHFGFDTDEFGTELNSDLDGWL